MPHRTPIVVTIILAAFMLQGCYTSKVRTFGSLAPTDHITRITTTDSIDVFITHRKFTNTIILPDAISIYSASRNQDENFLLEIPAEYVDYAVIDNSYDRVAHFLQLN
ncbi:MAG: hypothetical protein R2744_13145 [Bacteroidales bacterium]